MEVLRAISAVTGVLSFFGGIIVLLLIIWTDINIEILFKTGITLAIIFFLSILFSKIDND